jgi:hypothetical protein
VIRVQRDAFIHNHPGSDHSPIGKYDWASLEVCVVRASVSSHPRTIGVDVVLDKLVMPTEVVRRGPSPSPSPSPLPVLDGEGEGEGSPSGAASASVSVGDSKVHLDLW